jgi:hypothetical protein
VNPLKYLFRGALAGAVIIVLLYLLLVWICVRIGPSRHTRLYLKLSWS